MGRAFGGLAGIMDQRIGRTLSLQDQLAQATMSRGMEPGVLLQPSNWIGDDWITPLKPKTYREELQAETDLWLKDVA